MATKAASSTNMVADATNLNAVSGAGTRQESAGTCNPFTLLSLLYKQYYIIVWQGTLWS